MVRLLPRRDAPLRATTNPRMYGVLTANTPGCVAFSLTVQRWNLQARRSQRAFPVPPQPAPRAADMEWRFEPERRPVPDTFCVARGGLRHGRTDYSALERDPESWIPVFRKDPAQTRAQYAIGRRALSRHAGPSAKDAAVFFAAKILFRRANRLMRQTVLPTNTPQTIATTRGGSSARRFVPVGMGSARRRDLRFGLPLTPESGGPSRHRAAQFARAMLRARRLQELQNAQQDVDRCHPPGRDPGRRGPRQPRRRI
jgi:hypothetical protein